MSTRRPGSLLTLPYMSEPGANTEVAARADYLRDVAARLPGDLLYWHRVLHRSADQWEETDVTETGDQQKLVDLMQDMPIAMLTTFGKNGPRSVPMARQEVEPSAEMWFISARDAQHIADIHAQPQVALTFSSRDAWVALSGHARVVDNLDKLNELWNTFAEAWLPGGPESPEAVLIHVDVDKAEYWDSPGGKVASLISFAKTKVTGGTYDAEHGTVQP